MPFLILDIKRKPIWVQTLCIEWCLMPDQCVTYQVLLPFKTNGRKTKRCVFSPSVMFAFTCISHSMTKPISCQLNFRETFVRFWERQKQWDLKIYMLSKKIYKLFHEITSQSIILLAKLWKSHEFSSNLRLIGTHPSTFSTIIPQENNFCEDLFASLDNKALTKRGLLFKEFALRRANSFL